MQNVPMGSMVLAMLSSASLAGLPLKKPEGTPKIAAIMTEWRQFSHADVLVAPMIRGYTLDLEPHWPRVKIASMYVDQFPESDLSRAYAKHNRIPIYETIEQALMMGTDGLAVDGVLVVGEHGQYPRNELGQHMYPRRKFFEAVIGVFEKTGQVVPVFNDKHLAYNWADAKWMYTKARELGVPFMAGSSLVTCWRRPWLQFDGTEELEQAVVICYGGIEAYGFHGLETLQCMVEHRKGGETGVRSVQLLDGPKVWKALDDRPRMRRLADVALERIAASLKKAGSMRENCTNPYLYLADYNDGLKAAVLGLSGHVNGWGFAAQRKGKAEPVATEFWLQEPVFGHFNYLARNIEEMFLTGVPTYPVERTLLTTGILEIGMESRHQGSKKKMTPELNIRYHPSTRRIRCGGDTMR